MTKEELLSKKYYDGYGRMIITIEYVNEFFNSNVCIPKGENRHRYADVLHKWIEDTTKELQYNSYANGISTWERSSFLRMYNIPIRIKPSEPVYEWLWMDLRTPDTYDCPTGKYMTVDEASLYFRQSKTCFRVEETKRVRV